MTKIILFGSGKGGIGKSVCSEYTARLVAANGKRALIIDLDHMNASSRSLLPGYYGDGTSSDTRKSIRRVFKKEASLRSQIERSETRNVYIVPGDSDLGLYTPPPFILKQAIDELMNDGHLQYDYIIIDTHPEVSAVELTGAHAADLIITPIKLANAPMEASKGYGEFLESNGIPLSKWKVFIMRMKDIKGATPRKAVQSWLEYYAYLFNEENTLDFVFPDVGDILDECLDNNWKLSSSQERGKAFHGMYDLMNIIESFLPGPPTIYKAKEKF